MSSSELFWPRDWRRDGRGLTAEIKDLKADLLKAAIDRTSEGCDQLELLAVEKRAERGGFVDHIGLVDPLEVDMRAAAGEWNYFLWSRTFTPGLIKWVSSGFPLERVAPVLAVNGLINLQYRRRLKGEELPTRIGCVNKIISTSGELFLHHGYEITYRTLIRRIRQADRTRGT